MTEAPRLKSAPDPFEAQFGETGSLRQSVGEHGRAHIDRWLHFIVLHRGDAEEETLARRVAINSPAYLIWPPEDDLAAASALDAILDEMRRRFGQVLVISLSEREDVVQGPHSARLPPFVVGIGSTANDGAVRAAAALGKAMSEVKVDLRRCKVEPTDVTPIPPVESLIEAADMVERVSFTLPRIYRREDGKLFPQLTHDLALSCGDALLGAACAYLADGSGKAPAHYRSLGRSAFLAAALNADRKLDRIARSFDFLLSVSPINSEEAMKGFLADGAATPPRFHYRPLTVDPDIAKRKLYAIDLAILEDPLLERLLSEKRREIDQQLTMLATRNTPRFRPASMLLYGGVEPTLLADAHAILGATFNAVPRGRAVEAQEIATAARGLADRYCAIDPRFDAKIEIRDDVAGLMVSGDTLMVSSHSCMPASRLDALLAHEVSIHLLTGFNGALQGLSIFRTGLAGYEGVQEGLGVFAEWAVGGLARARLRLLAGRVVAVDAMLRGASFVENFRLLTRDHGFSERGAFGIAARVHRSGGMAKDAIYLRGFRAVVDFVAAGASLSPFWLGKIAPDHVGAIEELLQRGLVQAPVFIPEFVDRADTIRRIERLRAGLNFQDMLILE